MSPSQETDKVFYYIPTDQIFVISLTKIHSSTVTTIADYLYTIQSEDGYYPADSVQIGLATYYQDLFYLGEL